MEGFKYPPLSGDCQEAGGRKLLADDEGREPLPLEGLEHLFCL